MIEITFHQLKKNFLDLISPHHLLQIMFVYDVNRLPGELGVHPVRYALGITLH